MAELKLNDDLAEIGQVLEMCRSMLRDIVRRAPGVKTFIDEQAFILNEINPALGKLHRVAAALSDPARDEWARGMEEAAITAVIHSQYPVTTEFDKGYDKGRKDASADIRSKIKPGETNAAGQEATVEASSEVDREYQTVVQSGRSHSFPVPTGEVQSGPAPAAPGWVNDENPYLLSGDELAKTEAARRNK